MNKTGAGLCLLFLFMSLAQIRPAPAAGNEEIGKLTRAVIQVERRQIIADTLDLDPEEAEVFWPLYDAFTDEAGLVKQRHAQLVDDYLAAYNDLDDKTAANILDRWLDLEQKSLNIKRTWIKRFSRELPATTVARFFQLDNRMNVTIKAELAQLIPALR